MNRASYDVLVAQAIDEAARSIIRDGRPPSVAATLDALQRLAQRVAGYSRDYTLLNLRTVEDIAALYGVTPSGVRRMAADRHERFGIGTKVGGAWLFAPDEVEAFRPHYRPEPTNEEES